jgi:hypothetical protein
MLCQSFEQAQDSELTAAELVYFAYGYSHLLEVAVVAKVGF